MMWNRSGTTSNLQLFLLLLFLLLFSGSNNIRTAAAVVIHHNKITAPIAARGLENSPLTTVQAVIGQSVLLPCDVTASGVSDAPMLVLFFYANKGTPIFSVDARGSSMYSGEHWSDPDQLGTRGSVKVRSGHQGLYLTKLVPEDAGQYRCRVDFKTSPTKNFRINLQIITPPRHILVTSSWDGGRIVSGVIGPYPEGADLTLSCQVTGGTPPPSVIWWQGGSLLDSVSEIQTEQVTRNSLRLPRLTRDDLLKKFTCVASNNNITTPLSSAITIDIAFPPTSVRIWLQNEVTESLLSDSTGQPNGMHQHFKNNEYKVLTIQEGKEARFACEAYGSRPQAFVLWKKNNRVIVNNDFVSTTQSTIMAARSLTMTGDAASISSLKMIPSLDDHKAIISCTTYSPKLPDEALVDHVILNVLYQPKISLTYESKIMDTSLEVGDSFSLECHIDSNPTTGSVQWAKDGVPIKSSQSSGIDVHERRLEVQHATRHLTGAYTCAAANSQGVNTSRPLHLRIKFTPICSSQQKKQYGVGRKEGIEISCTVDSHPGPMTFRWAFNRTTEIKDIAQNMFTNSGMTSKLRYIPHTEQDFGSLLCWAANDVGLMKEPCVIQIVPAAKPDGVQNCRVVNNSSMPRSVALITCTPGYDGGLNQTFSLEVREYKNLHSRPLATVQHSPIPVFYMKRLKHGEEYLFIITAVNSRGTSPPTTLSYIVPNSGHHTLASNSYDSSQATWISWTLFIAVVFGCLITSLICFCAALFIMRFRTPKSNKNSAKIVYAGPIRNFDDNKPGNLTAHNIIHCGKPGCEDEKLVKIDYTQTTKEGCMPTLDKQRNHDIVKENDKFIRNSGSDVRICTPNSWTREPNCTAEETYIRNPGYHMHSLSPPPPPIDPKHDLSSSDDPFSQIISTRVSQKVSPLTPSKHISPSVSIESLPRSSSSSQHSSNNSSKVLRPDYYAKDDVNVTCKTPLMHTISQESAV
uniref:Protein turtle homolog A-like n=4 Tax=Hirondellea gigas TaxID=1518452 RepID=A0A6A7FZD0_9CRUS